MEGHSRTPLKNASNLLTGWPEKTNRKLVAVVVVLLLLGVPAMSMTLMGAHVDRQTIEIEPGSYRAFNVGIYGVGTLEYSYGMTSGSEVYLMELDRVDFYRFFLTGESFDYESYHRIPDHGQGGASISGPIMDSYIVLVNNGASTAYVEFELNAKAYLSLLPVAAILIAVSVGAYWMGRQEDKKAGLDLTDPIVTARRPVRMRALKVMAALSVLPIVTMLVMGAVLPTLRLLDVVQLLGFFMGLLISVALVFQLRFRLAKASGAPDAILKNLAYRLRVSGYRVTEEEGRLDVQISSASAVRITAKETSDGTWVLYKTGATPKGLGILIMLFVFLYTIPLTLPLALFMLYRTSIFAGTRVLPRLSPQPPVPQAEATRADTRALIIESLSEGRRLSAEAYESARSNYQDFLIITAVAGLILGSIVGITAYTQIDSSAGGVIALVAGIASAAVFCAVSWRQVSARSKPVISELKGWAAKLDAALSREASGRSPSDIDPSAFELIADSLREMPKWLKARRRAGAFRQPVLWILAFILLYSAFSVGFMGLVFWLTEGRLASGAVLLAVSAALVLLALLSNRTWKKRLDREYERTASWWRQRDEALRSEMEKLLAGE